MTHLHTPRAGKLHSRHAHSPLPCAQWPAPVSSLIDPCIPLFCLSLHWRHFFLPPRKKSQQRGLGDFPPGLPRPSLEPWLPLGTQCILLGYLLTVGTLPPSPTLCDWNRSCRMAPCVGGGLGGGELGELLVPVLFTDKSLASSTVSDTEQILVKQMKMKLMLMRKD